MRYYNILTFSRHSENGTIKKAVENGDNRRQEKKQELLSFRFRFSKIMFCILMQKLHETGSAMNINVEM